MNSVSRTSGGGGQRFMHLSDRPAGGGEPSSQAFCATRMLVIEMPCFVLCSDIVEERHRDYRSNNARHDCHCVSDLASWLHRSGFPGFTTWRCRDFEAITVKLYLNRSRVHGVHGYRL